jgi:RTX calcium-binding nonapeptide repeat (4 copies)
VKTSKTHRKLSLEALQSRKVLAGEIVANLNGGQLYIEGTESGDRIEISQVGAFFQVSGVNRQFASRNITSIRVTALGGNDSIVTPQILNRAVSISIAGGAGDDRIVGSPQRDLIQGGSGNDIIYGGGGDDAIGGGSGNDVINGDNGNDDIYGDSGNDHAYGNVGDDRILGGDDSDYLDAGSGRDRVEGGLGDDMIRGGDGNDELQGNNGDDWIFGGLGDDGIGGGSGKDVINGDDGNDWIYGDGGINDLYGNIGEDRVFGKIGLDFMRGGHGLDHINGGGDDFEVLGVDDSDFRRGRSGGTGSGSSLQNNKVEGIITAIDLSSGQVTIRTRIGENIVVKATSATKIERNDAHVPLSDLVIGDHGEAIYGNDLIAAKLESSAGGDSGGDSGGGNSSDPARRNKVEGSITAIDLAKNQVTIETRSGATFILTIASTTKIERNDRHVALSAIRIGDRGEALYGNDLVAGKLEAVGP